MVYPQFCFYSKRNLQIEMSSPEEREIEKASLKDGNKW